MSSGPCGICLVISDPTRQRPPVQFLVWALALSVIFSWLYNRTDGSLPIVIMCHAAIDRAGRFMLPEFAGAGYQVVWWFMVGPFVPWSGSSSSLLRDRNSWRPTFLDVAYKIDRRI